jgi:hypothetical protein
VEASSDAETPQRSREPFTGRDRVDNRQPSAPVHLLDSVFADDQVDRLPLAVQGATEPEATVGGIQRQIGDLSVGAKAGIEHATNGEGERFILRSLYKCPKPARAPTLTGTYIVL